MTINLADYEAGTKYDGDYADDLKAAQQRLAHAHFGHIVHGKRAIIAIEGWDAAGKGGVIRRMVGEWDPRYYTVWSIGAPTALEKDMHFLWRFWQKLPASGHIAIFDRSWYGRVLVERVEGFCSEREWKRGYDEINEFEVQQIETGTTLIKLFFHVTQETQNKRLKERLGTPEKLWKVTAEDFRNRSKREPYLDAMHAMFAATDTRWAPWAAFDSNNKKAARIAVMNHVAERLEAAVPEGFPDPDPAIAKLARKAFG